MGKKIREEEITCLIIDYLKKKEWEIDSYDFPQSGSGFVLHPNDYYKLKKKGLEDCWIPDIIAHKEQLYIFLENKVFFDYSDINKLKSIKESGKYDKEILEITNGSYEFLLGIGLLLNEHNESLSISNLGSLDLVILINRGINPKIIPNSLIDKFQ